MAALDQVRFQVVHFGRYVARNEGLDGAVVKRDAVRSWICDNRKPIDGGPPSATLTPSPNRK